MHAEWRHNNGYDSVLIIAGGGQVVTWFQDNVDSIRNILVDPTHFDDWIGQEPAKGTNPDDYGVLVMARYEDGYADMPDLDLFRERLAFWFHE